MLWLTIVVSLPALWPLAYSGSAIGLGALTVVPALVVAARRKQLIIDEPIIVIGIMWFMALPLPYIAQTLDLGLNPDRAWFVRTTWSLDLAALWLYRAWACCCIAYWVGMTRKAARQRPPSVAEIGLAERLRVLIGIVGLVASVGFLIRTGGHAYSHLAGDSVGTTTVDQIISDVRVLATIYVFLFAQARARNRLLRDEKYLGYAVLGVLALVFFATSTKAVPLGVGSAWLLGSASGGRRTGIIRDLLVGIVALVLIYSTFYIVAAYRNEIAAHGIRPNASFAETLDVQLNAFATSVEKLTNLEPITVGGDEEKAGIFDRLAHVISLALVFDTTHGVSPYENSMETLLAPVIALLPRDLIGDKVIFMNSGAFAALQGWRFGGLSLSTPGSIFWAWGFEGIAPGMALLGGLLAWVRRLSLREGVMGVMGGALMMRLVEVMLDVGADFQPLVVGLVRTLILLLLLKVVARYVKVFRRQ